MDRTIHICSYVELHMDGTIHICSYVNVAVGSPGVAAAATATVTARAAATATATAAAATAAATSQQLSHLAKPLDHHAQGPNIPFGVIPHFDLLYRIPI